MLRIGRDMLITTKLTGELARKSMIDVTVMRFVGTHDDDHIA